MALASIEDINIHLPDDKIEVDSALYVPIVTDAERIVRGYLAGYIAPTVLVTWISPESTPELIRAIAGRLGAFFRYAVRYSEDSLQVPEYALFKYNEAINWLTAIQAGSMVIEELANSIGSGEIGLDDYTPNAATPGPYFTMDQRL